MTYHDLMGIEETPEYQASLAEWNRTSRPGADEYLTDRELAIVSLLVGNWPRGVKLPAKVGDVLTLEVEVIQKARARWGVLRTADEKRTARVGPSPRRRPR